MSKICRSRHRADTNYVNSLSDGIGDKNYERSITTENSQNHATIDFTTNMNSKKSSFSAEIEELRDTKNNFFGKTTRQKSM